VARAAAQALGAGTANKQLGDAASKQLGDVASKQLEAAGTAEVPATTDALKAELVEAKPSKKSR